MRTLARLWAKLKYVWKLEVDAGTDDVNAKLAQRLADDRHIEHQAILKEIAGIEESIKEENDRLERGYLECAYGHQHDIDTDASAEEINSKQMTCGISECQAVLKLVKLSDMTPKEKYDIEKEKHEAEKVLASKRQHAEQKAQQVKGGEDTAKHYRGQAQNGRIVADRVRHL